MTLRLSTLLDAPARASTAHPRAVERSDGARPWSAAVLLLIALAGAAFAWALLAQHRAYYSNAYDLGFFDQIIWNTSQGRPFETTFIKYNFLGQHVEPVLLLFAALYRVSPSVEAVLVIQAGAVAAAAWPLYLAVRRLATPVTGAVAAIAYLFAPHVHGAVLFDFHPETFGPLILFSAFALLVYRRPWAAAGVAALLLLLKEDAALAVLGFAFIAWLRGARRPAIVLAAGSLLYLGLVTAMLMPAIRGGPGDLQERYGYLGTDTAGVLRGALTRPDLLWEHLAGEAQRRHLLYLLATLALLPLGTPAVLAAAPGLAANLLATHPAQHDLTLHYAVLPHALLTLAAALLLARARYRRLTTGALLLASVAAFTFGSNLGPVRFEPSRYRQTDHTRAVARVLAAVPPDAPVSAQSGLLPHLSQRREVWEFPMLQHATWVAVDTNAWKSSQSEAAGYRATLARLPELGFCRVREEDGATVWAKGEPCASP